MKFEVSTSLDLNNLKTSQPTPQPSGIPTETPLPATITPEPTQTPSPTPNPVKNEIKATKPPVEKPKTAVKGNCEAYRAILSSHFPENQIEIAIQVMSAESGCNPSAVGDKHLLITPTTGMSCGLMQVRVLPGRPDCETLKDPNTNIAHAAKLFAGGGWSHWSVCKNGKVNCGLGRPKPKPAQSQPDTKTPPASSSAETKPSPSPSHQPSATIHPTTPPKSPLGTPLPVSEKAPVEENTEPPLPELEA